MNILDRNKIPPPRKTLPFQLQSPEKRVLSNGLPVFIFDNERLDLIHFALRIQAGTLYENRKFVANPTYGLLMESVPGLTSGDVEDRLDFYGAFFQSSVGHEYITLEFIIPKSTIQNILPFIFSFISSPCYKEENLNLYKQRKIKELEFNSQKISYRAGQLLYHTFLNPELPTSHMLTKTHISSLSPNILQAYHQSTFHAENVSLFVSGNVNQEIIELIQDHFSQIPSGKKTELPTNLLITDKKGEEIIETRDESLQSSIMIGRPTMAYEHEDRRSFSVASTILGGYFGSRLMQNLREKNGYTYGVQAGTNYFGDTSIFYIHTEINVDKTQDALRECRLEMKKLVEHPVEKEELDTVKSYMEASLLRKLDGSVDYMRQYMLWHASGLDETEFESMKQTIQEIDAKQIEKMAVHYLSPEDFTTIIVGRI